MVYLYIASDAGLNCVSRSQSLEDDARSELRTPYNYNVALKVSDND
jgi:hypothetical protein